MVYVHIEVCADGYDVHMHVIHVEGRDPYQESSLVSPNLILLRDSFSHLVSSRDPHFCVVPTRLTNVMVGMTYALEIKSILLV